MLTAAYDLRYLRAALDQLENYLLSKDIYRPIGLQAARGETPYPQLTLGWLLLTRQRARATAQALAELSELERLSQQLDALRSHWRTAWSNKAQAEFGARLNLWRDFLEDYRHDPAANLDRYAYEVNRRLLLDLLASEVDHLPDAEQQALAGLDDWLRAVLLPSGFIWEPVLASAFPRPTYWYLYARLSDHVEKTEPD